VLRLGCWCYLLSEAQIEGGCRSDRLQIRQSARRYRRNACWAWFERAMAIESPGRWALSLVENILRLLAHRGTAPAVDDGELCHHQKRYPLVATRSLRPKRRGDRAPDRGSDGPAQVIVIALAAWRLVGSPIGGFRMAWSAIQINRAHKTNGSSPRRRRVKAGRTRPGPFCRVISVRR